ncbi:DUF983 domain-containing protein [Pseudoroseicyclus tamaricis]|uniref:DUF983 domain-containing protein n=1 Tax=Pseudoroseicyclus tamaricis TaxID=2705421 RepID=A0A6B2JW19_9RHOB|nr:DUF983 domain-containing protein [Pseudoroseicyclus tamaricis]NDV00414.1 DUF983 domain-containing protein [Pseudoroseicyclus tamaricis]
MSETQTSAPSSAARLGEREIDDRPLWPALRRGFRRRCPHCGEGHLLHSYLKVNEACDVCGEDYTAQRADDGPAYLTILVVGHVIGFVIHFLWSWFQPEPWVMATSLTTIAVVLSLWLLPRIKGAFVALQWSRRMHGFSVA